MKPIKFRGKRTDSGKWVKGQYCKMVQDCYVVRHTIITSFTIDELDWYQPMIDYDEVDEKTIGQFTGLKDKNGVEIYEGDIVRWINSDGESVHSVVEFVDGAFRVHNVCFTLWDYLDNDAEVIGNIHDNPELVEGEE